MRKVVLLALFLVPLALPLAALAQDAREPEEPETGADAAARLPDLRCFYVQGRCAPGGAAVGQTSTSRNQIHNLLAASWDPSARILANDVWKHVAVTGSWVAAAKILPAAVHCDTYLAFIKGQAGVPQELWCAPAWAAGTPPSPRASAPRPRWSPMARSRFFRRCPARSEKQPPRSLFATKVRTYRTIAFTARCVPSIPSCKPNGRPGYPGRPWLLPAVCCCGP